MFVFVYMDRTLATQTRHTKSTAEGHLHSRHIEGQGMEVKKPFAHKVPGILHAQDFLVEHGNPFGAAAADHILDRFGALQVKRLQTQ
ncbi:hypothetical protein D3C85_1051160 [compost metagenome]